MNMVYADTPVGFHRLNPGPLDNREIFDSNAALFDYINNETAYHGQRVLVRYDGYDQTVTLKKGKGDKLIPVLDLQNGYELTTKTVNNRVYALVLYFNDTTVPTDEMSYKICLNKPYFFSMMYQCSLIANSETSITFRLEVNSDNAITLTNQPNPLGNSSTRPAKSAFDRAKESMRAKNIVRLWVDCTDYYKAMGV